MPFDPSKPVEDTTLDAAEMREQFQSLKALIDAVPVVNLAQVDSVSTLNPGDNASANASLIGNTLHLDFAIPRGDAGATGQQGAPFADALVDSVSTLNPGDAATVQVAFDGSHVRFAFGIPRGNDGSIGADGQAGSQGLPGEVSSAQLASAIGGTSGNSNGVATLGLAVSDPPTQGEIQAISNKMDELILALRR